MLMLLLLLLLLLFNTIAKHVYTRVLPILLLADDRRPHSARTNLATILYFSCGAHCVSLRWPVHGLDRRSVLGARRRPDRTVHVRQETDRPCIRVM